jgi:hypothetical protein
MELRLYLVVALCAGGCSLINSGTTGVDYSFDPQQFSQKLGDPSMNGKLQPIPCDPTSKMDACAMAQASLGSTLARLACNATTKSCEANVELRLPYPVDLSMQMTSLPPSVISYGVNNVTIKKIAYWVMTNTVNVSLPAIDLWVAPSAAKDENDPTAVKVGSVAGLPARSGCVDAADKDGDPNAGQAAVCDLMLSSAGETALGTFVKNYQTPFQFIAHARFTVKAGEPLPTGTLDFFMRPTVTFTILK